MLKRTTLLGFLTIVSISSFGQTIDTYTKTYDHELDKLVKRLVKKWDLPGMAIGIVKDDQVVYAKGFGYADLESKEKATPQSIYRISSMTKSFTALTIGSLVQEEIIDLDEPIQTYYPPFQMKEDYKNSIVSMRDLLAHRTGLPRHDILWFFPKENLTQEDFFKNIRYLESNMSLREKYQYNNIIFSYAAFIGEQVSQTPWEELLTKRVLDPLELRNTFLSRPADIAVSTPYVKRSNEVRAVDLKASTISPYIATAGDIFSNVDDINKYLLFLLKSVKEKENPITSKAFFNQMISPQSSHQTPNLASYGLGLRLVYHNGNKIVWHAGASTGYSSIFTFVPEHNIGLVVLSNAGFRNPSTSIIRNTVLDKLLKAEGKDWEQIITKRFEERNKDEEEGDESESIAPKKSIHYLGTYTHPAYGTIIVNTEQEQLELNFNGVEKFIISHKNGDTFDVVYDIREDVAFPMTFLSDDNGQVNRVEIPFEETVAPIVFRKKS